ncbi:MAG: trypsin-like peptidase domain-containing protein [Lentisphaerae bacterium]|nr:trypsin-like peptidase domain-containing protein [Lentisphaerota bacterium]
MAALEVQAAWLGRHQFRESVVKVYATIQREDYAWPWQPSAPYSGSGSGFIIYSARGGNSRKRILTNAHVVSDARFIEVQREGQSRRYPAQVAFIGHDCDLAVLTVSDPEFFAEAAPMELGVLLPDLNEEVTVLGYPIGGERLSLTRGVVSRIDYRLYTHSQVDSHLVLQVDAAINPGNSGGPVLFKNRVVGVAFQGIPNAQNLGYAIPLPVIQHFLTDIADGVYDGYPELGITHLETPNPAMRRRLNLPVKDIGVVVAFIDPFGCAAGILATNDTLLAIDGHAIASDGTVRLDRQTVEYIELLERKQCGESVAFKVWRNAQVLNITVPLVNRYDPFALRYAYERRPEYFIISGLVFAPLSRGLLMAAGGELIQGHAQHLLYYATFAKTDGLIAGRDQFVILQNRLAHPVNAYDEAYLYKIVREINGLAIRDMNDLPKAFGQPTNGFHVVRFLDDSDPLVLDAAEAQPADATILQRYAVPEAKWIYPASRGSEPAAGKSEPTGKRK